DLGEIARKTRLCCSAIEFTEYTTPIPPEDFGSGAFVFRFLTKRGENCCQWRHLGLIRQITSAKDVLAMYESASHFETRDGRFNPFLIVVQSQSKDVFTFTCNARRIRRIAPVLYSREPTIS